MGLLADIAWCLGHSGEASIGLFGNYGWSGHKTVLEQKLVVNYIVFKYG